MLFLIIRSVVSKNISKSKTLKFSDTALRVSLVPQKLTTLSKIERASRIAPSDFCAIIFNASSSASTPCSFAINFR